MSPAFGNTRRAGNLQKAVNLNVEGLTVRIGQRQICDDFNLQIRPGEHWGILGGNGVGKTTLLHTLAGLRKPVSGRIMLDNIDVRNYKRLHLARQVGVLFQDSRDTFPATVKETVLTGRYPYQSFWPPGQREDSVLADLALERLNLKLMQDRQVDTLSGGERRRLALATLFLQDPGLWLLDEPTNHLDFHHQIQVLDLVGQRVRERNGALLMVLHDVNLISRYCSHAILMLGTERILRGEVAAVINKANLENLYRHPIHELSSGDRKFYFPA